ncbi:MAG: peptidase S24 [Synechococcus sp. SB0669_bin_7]|nr:peptidase S24 [Synechococcus sp. SB0675_bin_7]MYK84914.1 peptidase S24 [Synechococcus sp. SB0669_bin_7]
MSHRDPPALVRPIQGIVTLLGFRIVRVSGLSMVPALADGDFVLFRRFLPGESPCPGTIVIVRHRRLGIIIKLLDQETKPGHFRLRGLSALSTDSNRMGNTARQNIMGQAVLRIGRHGVSGLRVS